MISLQRGGDREDKELLARSILVIIRRREVHKAVRQNCDKILTNEL